MTARTWVLMRGLIREQRHWEDFPDVLADHLPGARIVTLDLPGNGSRWREDSRTTVAAMVEAAREDLAGRGIQGPFSLLSLSLGGMVALEWMNRHPDEIRRAVVMNSSLSAFSPFWRRLRPENYARILRTLLFSRDPEARERMILEISTNLLPDREPYVRRWTAWARECPVSTRNAFVQLLAAARYRSPSQPPSQPVLILNGGNDRLVHPSCSERIARAWGVPMRRHDTAGHDLALDAGEWVAREVAAFARSETGGRGEP